MAHPSVFVSYSHRDERWRELFVKHLSVLEGNNRVEAWSDRRISAGEDWLQGIERALDQAQVAVLLISANFLTSSFILTEEVPRLLRRREQEGVHLIPVIVGSCSWKNISWLRPILARPQDGRSLASFRGDKRDAAIVEIVDEIVLLLKKKAEESSRFLESYRQSCSALYSRWDLGNVGVTQTGSTSEPIVADLDQMYLPLRLAEGYDIRNTTEGSVVTPSSLLSRKSPLVIRGVAGSGKTTWMRWTFRRLLDPALNAFPLMLVLRDLAVKWKDKSCQGSHRSLDAFLEGWIAQHIPGWESHLAHYLRESFGPRPVLLVDGWDEVGPLGEELREKLLGFMTRYPRVIAVVTSRPYGKSRPSDSDRFDVLDIQPLSDADIDVLAHRFFARCQGRDGSAAELDTEHFRSSLKRAPEPQALARTALLLTMMLLIARSRPLPDKRHLLYQACIENLLNALPDRKEEEGVLLLREQWRPTDVEERMRVMAELAFRLKMGNNRELRDREAIVRTWEEMASLLPGQWSETRRMGFLTWLVGPAGLLTDRADGTLVFTHLSFQEYLAAWHLDATSEGEERVKLFRELLDTVDWWETLRLWAALLHRQRPAKLEAILAALYGAGGGGIALGGCLFADGLGSDEHFEAWLGQLGREVAWQWPLRFDLCGRAWSASRQDERRDRFARQILLNAAQSSWLAWLRWAEISDLIGLAAELHLPVSPLHAAAIRQVQTEVLVDEPASLATSRLWSGGPPVWPTSPIAHGLLQVWPTERRIAGSRLQLAATLGASRMDLAKLATSLLVVHSPSKDSNKWARVLARDGAHGWARYWARELARYWARYWPRYWTRHWARALARSWARDWAQYLAHDWANDWPRDGWYHDWARDWARSWARELARDEARELAGNGSYELVSEWVLRAKLDERQPWIPDFARMDFLSFGRAGVRAQMAAARVSQLQEEQVLFAAACRLSLHPNQDPTPFEESLARYAPKLDPLWPALARHLARRSTTEDRALLIDLAQNPELREPPLRWGLQFIVRGDVMLEDGSVVILDELADEAEVPRLPFLDGMPDELEVDWDAPVDPEEAT